MTLLGAILNGCNTEIQKRLGKLFTLTASSLGDPNATLNLLRPAHRTGKLQASEYAKPMQHLRLLANEGHVRAMVLLGRIFLDSGKDNEALSLFNRAAESTPNGTTVLPADIAEGLIARGQILHKLGQVSEASSSFQTAALDYDHPAGYHFLAQLQASGSPTQEVYLLKAASSGIIEAAYELGAMYFQRVNLAKLDEDDGKRQLAMAKEWLYLGASGGHGESMLAMSALMKEEGRADESMRWLRAAKEVPEFRDKAEALIEGW